MADINLEYLNDRYLAFVLPLELRRLVSQGAHSWFMAGNEEERAHFQEKYDDAFPIGIHDLARNLKSAIRNFTDLVECWDMDSLSEVKLHESSEALTTAIDEYVKTLNAAWYDERHRCYMKIANYYGQYDQMPGKLQSWDLLGSLQLDHDANGIKDGNRIIIKNRTGTIIDDIQIKKESALPFISAIKTVGWYNAERLAMSQATIALMDCLTAPHRQLFEMGSLLADVNWGNAWHSPTLDCRSRKNLTVSLPKRVEKLACKLWYLLPDSIMPKLKLLRNQQDCSAARLLANRICRLCHAKLYRAKHGIADCAYECQLLAFDLLHLVSKTLSTEQKVSVFARGSKYYAELLDAQPPPVNTFAELASLARRHRPRWTHIQIGYKSSQAADVDVLKPLEIWDVLKLKKKDGDYLVFAREHCVGELEHDAGVFFKLLLQAKGDEVPSTIVEQKLKKKGFKVSRIKGDMPKEISTLIASKPGSGNWLKNHTALKDCKFLLDVES